MMQVTQSQAFLKGQEENTSEECQEAVRLLEGAYRDVCQLDVDEADPAFKESSAAASELTADVRLCNLL